MTDPRWYLGGVASAGSCFLMHPFDMVKMKMEATDQKTSSISITRDIIRNQGFTALYGGLSASILRQMTYSTTRFGVYELLKKNVSSDTLVDKITLASISGAIGGLVGTPSDLIKKRMMNDYLLPPPQRLNYKNPCDGLFRIYRSEGVKALFSGAIMSVSRGILMTVGQAAFYDHIKSQLLKRPGNKDDLRTHALASTGAGLIAAALIQPLGALKTPCMDTKPGIFNALFNAVKFTVGLGPRGFCKGCIVSFVQPKTLITLLLLEQLRIYFAKSPQPKK